MSRKLLILGYGGHGKVVYETAMSMIKDGKIFYDSIEKVFEVAVQKFDVPNISWKRAKTFFRSQATNPSTQGVSPNVALLAHLFSDAATLVALCRLAL